MVTRSRDNTRKSEQFPDHLATTNHPLPPIPSHDEPTSFTVANKDPAWREAMATELNALIQNNTWVLVPPPVNQHVVGCKWIYQVKKRADGSIERYKARLVAKGYTQEARIDYEETFSPVIKPADTIRLVLSLAVSNGWVLHKLDVNNAFFLHETVYQSQPPGFVDSSHPDYVCLLKKALYGLKQAPRAWFHKLASSLHHLGFCTSHSDSLLFIRHTRHDLTLVLVYVDDIIVKGSSSSKVNELISSLATQFSLKDLWNLHLAPRYSGYSYPSWFTPFSTSVCS
jgi:hypothetical protein